MNPTAGLVLLPKNEACYIFIVSCFFYIDGLSEVIYVMKLPQTISEKTSELLCFNSSTLHCYLSVVPAAAPPKNHRPSQLPHLPRLCQRAPRRPHALAHLLHHRLRDHRDGGRAPERDVRLDRRRGVRGRHQLGRRHRGGLGHLQRRPGPLLRPLPLVHPGGKVGDRKWRSHVLHTQAGAGRLGLMLALNLDAINMTRQKYKCEQILLIISLFNNYYSLPW